MRFGTLNVRSLYQSGSLITAVRELAGYKLDFYGVLKVRWDKGGTARAFFSEKENERETLAIIRCKCSLPLYCPKM